MQDTLAVVGALALIGLLLAWVGHDRRVVLWIALLAPCVPVEYIDRYHVELPSLVSWAPFFGLAFAGAAAFLLLPRRGRYIPPELVAAYGAVVVVSLVSLLVNGTALAAFGVSQRGYAVLFAALWALSIARTYIDTDRMLAMLVAIGLVSCCVSIAQRLLIVPFIDVGFPGDRVTGLFSVGFITLFYHLFCVVVVLTYTLVGRRLLPGSPWWQLLLLFVGIGVGNQKAAVLYLALAVVLTVFGLRTPRAGAMRRGAVLAGSVGAIAVAAAVFAAIYNTDYQRGEQDSVLQSITDRDYLERYLLGTADVNTAPDGRLLRGSALQFVWQRITDSPVNLLLGLGPGETSESGFPGASGSLADRHPGAAIDRLALSMVLGDTGLLGLAAHGIFLYALLFAGGSRRSPPEHRAIRRVTVLLFVAYSVYANLYYEPAFALVAAALAYRPAEEPERSVALEVRCASA